jgi:hypothetical protein
VLKVCPKIDCERLLPGISGQTLRASSFKREVDSAGDPREVTPS